MPVDPRKILALAETAAPGIKDDLQEAFGLRTTQSDVDAAMPDAELGVVEGLANQIDHQARQIRLLGELVRELNEADGERRADLHRLRWQVEELMTEALHAQAKRSHEEAGTRPPEPEHVRRAVHEASEGASKTTTPEEDELIVKVLLASLHPEGVMDGLGARLRRLVTSGQVGAPELAYLRECAKSSEGDVDLQRPESLSVLFRLASAEPMLVTVIGAGRSLAEHSGYVTQLDQVSSQVPLRVSVTSEGRALLELIDKVAEAALGKTPQD